MNWGSDWPFACLRLSRQFRDVGFTKMKKKKVLYNKCISVEVFESPLYERSLSFFPSHLFGVRLGS